MKQPELNSSILSNPEARRAYYDQRRQNEAAREQQAKEARELNVLTGIAQIEIESATKQTMPPGEIEKMRARIKLALSRASEKVSKEQ